MKIVLAPDSFKGNLSSLQVATALEQGIRRVLPKANCVKVPIADGGEGTVRALMHDQDGRHVQKTVAGPRGAPVRARYGLLDEGSLAVIETAAVVSLPLLSPRARNPMLTSTRGVGELLLDAMDRGVKRIIIGLGGSSTNDGGAGMAQALGAVFRDRRGRVLRRPLAGGLLHRIHSIDITGLDRRLGRGCKLIGASDVTNPLYGPRGASRVFAGQKGADGRMIRTLDNNLRHWGRLIRRDIGRDVSNTPGAGAGGGLGAGLLAFCRATLRPGIDVVLQGINMQRHLEGADLVITGEGCLDAQTAFGKAPAGVARLARRCRVPTIAIAGGLGDDAPALFAHGIAGLESACAREMGLSEALSYSRAHLRNAAERVMRLLLVGRMLDQRH